MSTPTIWSAGRYEAVARRIAHIAEEVLDAVERRRPLTDTSLVDLACGTGNAALSALARGARVTGVDITPALLEIGSAKNGGGSVDWVAADASDTGLPGGAFDVAVSNMGVVFVEPVAQVREITRLLGSGGTVAFSTWVRSGENPLFDPVVAVLGAPPNPGHTPDQWGDPDIASSRLAIDFDDLTFESGVHAWEFDSHAEAMRFVTEESPMHLNVLGNVSGSQRAALIAAFDEAMRAHVDGGRVSFDSSYAVVTATRR
ncbi:MAG: class I SAM-dependent methyltransferase [Mycobacterium sp.]|nr:class I SAM-dependent methyltransferase [Mycobacterium sp.]